MTRCTRRTGAVRRFLGAHVVAPLHLSTATTPRESCAASPSTSSAGRHPVTLEHDMNDPSATEADPTGRVAHQAGAKLDAGKAPVLRGCLHYFPRALQAVAEISAHGASKYTWNGWESVPQGVDRYGDALARHILKELMGPLDSDSGLPHAAHAAWNALARLELLLRQAEQSAAG